MAPRKAVTSTALPSTPVTNTGLRPIRSESRAQNGIVQIAMRLATIASHSMKVLLKPMPKSSEVAKLSAKTWNIVLTIAMKAAKKTRSTLTPVVAEQHAERRLGDLVLLLLGLELRGLVELEPDVAGRRTRRWR